MDKKFKILAASDLHGDSNQALRLAEKAEKENVDLVVLCGDLSSPLQTKGIIKSFKDKGKRVVFVTGNHDGLVLGNFWAELYQVKHLHAKSTIYYDVGLFGISGANIGLDAWHEDEAVEILKNGFYTIKDCKKKIMVSHIHPEGTIVDKIEPGFGSSGIRKAIEKLQPDILLCGHIHQAEGMEDFIGKTKVFNVGRNGKIIELWFKVTFI
ncbi:MAG TPA: metallophosphoesterase [Candidatus Nanoarchaeia archaeon]|nr:metallophosphoesterase [Candidatus Nanoarchaeia archaeon]